MSGCNLSAKLIFSYISRTNKAQTGKSGRLTKIARNLDLLSEQDIEDIVKTKLPPVMLAELCIRVLASEEKYFTLDGAKEALGKTYYQRLEALYGNNGNIAGALKQLEDDKKSPPSITGRYYSPKAQRWR